ncbi:MAG: Ig-like domain repeat protein [Candidatus Sulfotelmatobacter sp.]
MTSKRTLTVRIRAAFRLVLAAITVSATLTAIAFAQNPVPFTNQPLVPDATAPGGTAFTLTVNGAGFVPVSVVKWNSSPRATTFVSSSQLTAKILASDIAKASTASVTVVNPSPGGGVSNIQFFSIAVAETSLSFLPAVTYVTGGYNPYSVAIADVNSDGKPDLIVVNEGTGNGEGSVGVLLGNGDGTFQSPVDYDSGGGVGYSVAVADVNGDGKLDIVVGNGCASGTFCSAEGSVGVLLGNGDGTFQPAHSYNSGGASLYGSSVALADLRGDGKLDIVVANHNASSVGVMLGNGDGTFNAALTYNSGGSGATSLAVADMNGDGKPDLVVTSFCPGAGCGSAYPYPDGVVGIMLGNGDGTFQSVVTYDPGGAGTYDVAVADVNGDGKPDLLTANCGPETCGPGSPGGTVGVLLGNGDGSVQPAVPYGAANAPFSIAVADLNGDGKQDAVVANWGTSNGGSNNGAASVLLGNGDGTFQPVHTYLSGGNEATSVAVADLTGDGRPDIVLGDYGSNGINSPLGVVSVLLNNAGASQSPTTTTLTSALNPSVYGQSVIFTATVSSTSGTPAGTVELYNGSTAIGSGTLTSGKTLIPVSSPPAGSDSVTATYRGSATYATSMSSPLIQTVSAATTATGLTSSVNPAGTGQSVTFTVTVTSEYGGAATGSVTFLSGSQTLGTATLSGNRATLTTSFATAGNYSVSAKYNGDGNNTGSTSPILHQAILAATTIKLTSTLNPSLVGQSITFTATVSSTAGSPPNGETVTFYNVSAVLGTAPLNGGIASLTTSSLLAGIYTVSAAYSGDANFAASTSPALRQVVNSTTKSATATTLISSLNPSIYGQSVTWTATVTPTGKTTPTGKVNFNWGSYSIGSGTLNASGVAALTRSNLSADAYPLFAVYVGDANNEPSTSAVLNQVVTEATSSAALTSSPNPSTAGQAVTFTATIKSPTVAATGPVTFSAGKTVLGTAQLANGKAMFTISTLAVGTTALKASYYGDSNISGSSAFATETVKP